MARGVDEGAAVRRVCAHLGLAPARGSPGARRTTPPAASPARSRRSSGKKIRRAGCSPASPRGSSPILVEIMARGVDKGAAVRRVCNHLGLAPARGFPAARRTTPTTASPARSRRSSGKENRRAGVSPARPKGSSPILVEIMARGVDEGAAVRRVCNHLGLAPARGSPGARRTTPPMASLARSRRSSGKENRRAGVSPARPRGAAVKRRCGTPTGPGRPGRPAPPCRARTT